MEPRMSHLLANLPDVSFFDRVSRGLQLIMNNVAEIDECARAIEGDSAGRGRSILWAVAAEEAAKYLILDAVRCPRRRQEERAQQLKRFNRHLAKGIYAEVVDIRPADYAELLGYIEALRQAYYLDGPNDVDWIFRNSIEAEREQALYVDYIETDEGADWFDPTRYDAIAVSRPSVIDLIEAMHHTGFGTPEGIGILAKVWRDFEPEPSMPIGPVWERIELTIGRMLQSGVASGSEDRHKHLIWDAWTFPLWSADLDKVDVDRDQLRERQERWSPY